MATKDIVEDLLTALKDSEANLEAAEANVVPSYLKAVYNELAQERAVFAGELERLAREQGLEIEEPEPDGSVKRGLLGIAATMTIRDKKTEQVVHNNVLASERELYRHYEDALDDELPAAVHEVVREQQQRIATEQERLAFATFEGAENPIVFALYRKSDDADRAILALEEAGFGGDDISILAREETLRSTGIHEGEDTVAETTAAASLGGTAIGGLIGLVAGASSLLSPELGSVLATGSLTAAVGVAAGWAGVGAVIGTVFGALIGFATGGEEDVYRETIAEGGVLVAVETDEKRLQASRDALERGDPRRLNVREVEEL